MMVEAIRQIKTDNNLTCAEFARMVGVSTNTIDSWLFGTRPSAASIHKIAKKFKINEEELSRGKVVKVNITDISDNPVHNSSQTNEEFPIEKITLVIKTGKYKKFELEFLVNTINEALDSIQVKKGA